MKTNSYRGLHPAIVLVLASLVAACSRHTDQAPDQKAAATPAVVPAQAKAATEPMSAKSTVQDKQHEDELMRAIFQGGYRPEAGSALAEITDDKGEKGKYLVTMISSTVLPDGRTAVAANAAQSDDEGNEQFGHASPGLLNVYFLRREGGEWKVLERRENVAALGSSGNAGTAQWVMLAPDRPGLLMLSGGTFQGYTVSVADIFDLEDGVRSLGGFKQHSDSIGACTPEMAECWDVSGEVRFVDNDKPGHLRDILVDFSGKKYTLTTGKDGNDIEHLKGSVRETARYRFDGKHYQLISGTNPVPDV